MRLFVALDLPQNVKDCIYELQRKLKTPAAKVSWVSKKHFHFTLKFLGEVDEKKVKDLVSRLSRIRKRAVKARLSKIGFFPDDGHIRVVWLGVEPEGELNGIAQDVDAELLDMFPGEQSFSAHITLGRVKSLRSKDGFLKKVRAVGIEPIEFEFSWIKLYNSVQKGSMYEHVCLKEF